MIGIVISFLFVIFGSISSDSAAEQRLVDYYVNLINNRTQEAFEYEFPTDARMYEATDKRLQGKIK